MAESRSHYRLGIDIGGTFTDATLIDETTGAIHIAKVLSTPHDPSIGFVEAATRILHERGVRSEEVLHVVHATTVATNAIIEGTIARTGFITTEGFRDMLEIARQIRPSLYDPLFEKPPPLVPRYLCFGVPERLDARGNVLTELCEDGVREVAQKLLTEEVESVAICLLHSYLNPVHERRVAKILQEFFPAHAISLSSEVSPEFREYVRASTTVINAGIRPVVHRYLEGIRERLTEIGLTAHLLVMQSGGGVFTAEAAAEKPVFMVESGPAAGVIAATYLGTALGYRDILSFDMGGTTAKVGLIQDGTPRITKDYQVGATAKAGIAGQPVSSSGTAASGYPIRTPVIDLVEIGAGGGSIAWIDSGGMLRVGPRSAGADPGPVCYARGGTQPTVTDANVVLGRLNPEYFLGGEIELDVDAARQAIERACAEPLHMDVVQAANAIVEIANAAMVNALRLASIQRGYDPRQFVLTAFGGGGPVHANALAAEIGVPRTVIPRSPGVFSSLGLLVTDFRREYCTTLLRRTEEVDTDALEASFQRLHTEGAKDLTREGVPEAEMTFNRIIDMRYAGQSHELPVPAGEEPLSPERVSELADDFHAIHDRANGFNAPGEPVELVNLRLTAIGRLAKPNLQESACQTAPIHPKAIRRVYFNGSFVDCPVYDRSTLGATVTLQGPALVEEPDSTTVIHPGYRATVDWFGNLLLDPSPPTPVTQLGAPSREEGASDKQPTTTHRSLQCPPHHPTTASSLPRMS